MVKISIGRASSETLDKKHIPSSMGSSSSAKLLLDEMYMASRKTSSSIGSISTGSLSDLSSRHSSKAPSERLSNASSLAALSEHIGPAHDSARSQDSATSGLRLGEDRTEEDRDASESGADTQSLSDRVAALLSEAVPRDAESDDEASNRRVSAGISEAGSNFSHRRSSTESEQDMEKINTQYTALLKSDLTNSGPLGSTESLGSDPDPATERELLRPAPGTDTVEITTVVREDGTVEHRPASRDLNSSVESDDALDRDVRRILAKYGRSFV